MHAKRQVTITKANYLWVIYFRTGYTPVINSHVEASVTIPSKDNVDLLLKDNGNGADVIANDGIYSTYFTDFSGLGRYSVQVGAYVHRIPSGL